MSGTVQTMRATGGIVRLCPSGTSSNAIALSFFAAECIVRDYLNGRTLPTNFHQAAVKTAESRLRSGEMPILYEKLCREIDDEATAASWKAPSVESM
jgi:hypothetical protein